MVISFEKKSPRMIALFKNIFLGNRSLRVFLHYLVIIVKYCKNYLRKTDGCQSVSWMLLHHRINFIHRSVIMSYDCLYLYLLFYSWEPPVRFERTLRISFNHIMFYVVSHFWLEKKNTCKLVPTCLYPWARYLVLNASLTWAY